MRPLFLLCILWGLTACDDLEITQTPPPTEAIAAVTRTASPSPTPMATVTPSPRPPATASATASTVPTTRAPATASATATGTATPVSATPSATATALPTFTPGAPDTATDYRLRPWSVEMADQLIRRMAAYPDRLPAAARGYNDANYYAAYRFAALLQRESLYRSAGADAAQHWQWELAYNYVRLGDQRATTLYAQLLTAALNLAETTPPTLPAWFAEREARLMLTLEEVTPLRQQQAAYLVTLDAGESGSHLWLVRDLNGFQVYPLHGDNDFDLAHGAGFSAGMADVTGDGVEDLVRVNAHQPGGSSTFYYTELTLYSLAQMPPQRIVFLPAPTTHLGWGEKDEWLVIRGEQEGPLFRLRGQPSERCAAVQIITDYIWNGSFMELADSETAVDAWQADSSRFCLPFVFGAAAEGNRDALRFLASGLGSDLLPETKDEWRYRLGLYEALAGNYEQAIFHLTEVISNPAGSDPVWARAAQRFRDTYSDPSRIYTACTVADLCDDRLALRRLATSIPRAAFAVASGQLREWGVPVVRSGFFDADGDGDSEQWLLVRDGLEFAIWLLARTPGAIDAFFLDTIARNAPFTLELLTKIHDRSLLQVNTGQDPLLFSIYKPSFPGSSLVIARLRAQSGQEGSDYTSQLLRESQTALFEGENADLLLGVLQTFRNSDAFNCTPLNVQISCAEYQYTVALSHELAGQEREAATAFVQLWREYPDSPLAIVARARLETVPTPTPTFTPTVLPSFTATSTPTATAISSTTATATLEP